uniref:Uncharacterized protein n=1 Tax=Anguilla anguilla TaxID=7936 RepID=A0A0E9PB08_ANGAN
MTAITPMTMMMMMSNTTQTIITTGGSGSNATIWSLTAKLTGLLQLHM